MTHERLKAWARAHGISEDRVISSSLIVSARRAEEMGLGHESRTPTREARIEEIERRRDTVLAECNPNLPTYEAK